MDSANGKEQLFSRGSSQDEPMYEASDYPSPEYDNARNNSTDEPMDPEERAKQEAEWRTELAKLEDEIQTFRQVLAAKTRQASELKRKLGITPMAEFRQDLKQGFQNIKESDAYQKTTTTVGKVGETISSSEAYQKTTAGLKVAGQKTTSALSTVGAFTSSKLGAMRNSVTFKSFEERIGGAYSNVKTRVRGSKSENNFEEALASPTASEPERLLTDTSPDGTTEKVPL